MLPVESRSQIVSHDLNEMATQVQNYVRSQLCSELALKRIKDTESSWISIDCFEYSDVPNQKKDPLLQMMFKEIIEHGYRARLKFRSTHSGREYYIQILNEEALNSKKCIIF